MQMYLTEGRAAVSQASSITPEVLGMLLLLRESARHSIIRIELIQLG